ncbi:MAG TPA: hypothetical protein VLV84_04040 [Candidatus Acidoferrales bacterium]|nr:hypothetical protein [Candidatus Acidoferrales bacterium]
MSVKKDKTVPQLVTKYRHDQQTCNLDRDLLRRIIRSEHPELFSVDSNPRGWEANLKKLDRYLKRAFEESPLKPISKPPKTPYVMIPDGKGGWVEPDRPTRGFWIFKREVDVHDK